MQAAYDYGSSVYSTSTSMPGDYTKAIMKLQKAIAEVVITGYNTGIFQSSSSIVMRSAASSGASTVTTVPASTSLSVTSVSGDYGYTKYMSYTGWSYIPVCTRLSGLSSAAAVITSVDERTSGSSLNVSWNSVSGAAGYIYKIIQLAGQPDPGNPNESLNSVQLAFVENTRSTSVTMPAASMTNGKYIKVAIAVVYPTSTVWSTKYITGSELPFTDVPTTSWYYNPVKYVFNAGLFSGTSGTTFSPEMTMSRGMMVTVLYRLAGQPSGSGTLTFTDVPTGSYYYNAIRWATQNGIASGYNSTTFGPDDNVMRQQAIMFIYRYASMAGCDMSISSGFNLTGYSDYSSISSYAVTAMTWAVDKGIISGNGNMLFPTDNATRAQIAAMMNNFNNNCLS
jgi:hypothetical protein